MDNKTLTEKIDELADLNQQIIDSQEEAHKLERQIIYELEQRMINKVETEKNEVKIVEFQSYKILESVENAIIQMLRDKKKTHLLTHKIDIDVKGLVKEMEQEESINAVLQGAIEINTIKSLCLHSK